jgi:hypothetical protein
MWRAFFFACGIMLIVLGLECIVVERFRISSDSGLNRLARKFIGSENGSAVNLAGGSSQAGIPIGPGGYGSAQSQFGPSRMNDSPFFNASVDNRQAAGNPVNLANSNSGALLGKPVKSFKTEDWMPWSLIAAGTIISLYTHSLRPGFQTN